MKNLDIFESVREKIEESWTEEMAADENLRELTDEDWAKIQGMVEEAVERPLQAALNGIIDHLKNQHKIT